MDKRKKKKNPYNKQAQSKNTEGQTTKVLQKDKKTGTQQTSRDRVEHIDLRT